MHQGVGPGPRDPHRGGKFAGTYKGTGKGTPSRLSLFLSGRAAIGSYLAGRTKTIRSNERWWCGN